MSSYFSKVIKAGERQREFNFRQRAAGTDIKYHVDVPDDKGNRIIFQMHRDTEGRWKTTDAVLPLWIHNAEDVLGSLISEQIREQEPVRRK